MKQFLILLAICCSSAFAEEQTLIIPQFTKQQVVPVEGDPLRAQYDAAWGKYEKSIVGVVADVTQALDAEFNKAADAGSLDSADMWDRKKKLFADTKTVACEVPAKTKVDARKKPKADDPKTFIEILHTAQQETDNAVKTLKSDLETLVRGYTKARNLERAKQLREEVATFSKALGERPRMAEAKPEQAIKPILPSNGAELQRFLTGTAWKNQTGFTFEWDMSGRLWHCKDGGRTAVTVAYSDGRKCAIEFVNGARQILVFRDDFSVFEQCSLDGKVLQPAVRLR